MKVQKVHLFRNFANFCEIQEKKTPNWKNSKIKIWIQNKYDKLQALRNIFLGSRLGPHRHRSVLLRCP